MGCCQIKGSVDFNPVNTDPIRIRNDDPSTPLLYNDPEMGVNDGIRHRPPSRPRTTDSDSSAPPGDTDATGRRRISISDSGSVYKIPSSSTKNDSLSIPRSSSAPLFKDAPVKAPLFEQTAAKLMKPIVELPAATDLPRMVHRITVISQDQVIFLPMGSRNVDVKPSNVELLAEFFDCLTNVINNSEEPDKLGERLLAAIPKDFDGELRAKLQPFLTEAIPEGSRISNVLKCINQGVVAPAVMSLRLQTAGKINFKDCRGEWNIVIRFQKGDGVHISHLKREQSLPEGFEFVWEFKLLFDDNLKELQGAELSISTLDFTTMQDPTEQDRIRRVFESCNLFQAPSPRKAKASQVVQ